MASKGRIRKVEFLTNDRITGKNSTVGARVIADYVQPRSEGSSQMRILVVELPERVAKKSKPKSTSPAAPKAIKPSATAFPGTTEAANG